MILVATEPMMGTHLKVDALSMQKVADCHKKASPVLHLNQASTICFQSYLIGKARRLRVHLSVVDTRQTSSSCSPRKSQSSTKPQF